MDQWFEQIFSLCKFLLNFCNIQCDEVSIKINKKKDNNKDRSILQLSSGRTDKISKLKN